MSKLLFIGGTGFLGQSFFDYINNEKIKKLKLTKIFIVSRQGKKIKSKIKTSYIKKSVTNLKKLPLTEYIIYAANSQNNNENIKGIKNFVNLLTKYHKKTKILFTSSGAVYGKSKIKKKFKENQKIKLKNVNKFKGYKKNYAKSKIFIENEFHKLGRKGYNVSIARLFTFIGKRILINNSFAITDLINQAKNTKTKEIIINSSSDVFRGYMDSNDLIRWIIEILKQSDNRCEIYNVGSDETVSIKKLSKLIAKKFKKNIKINNNKRINKNIDFYVPSILKAKLKLRLVLKFKLNKSLKILYKSI